MIRSVNARSGLCRRPGPATTAGDGPRIKEFGVPDSLGGTEKGISIATRAAAQVTAPCDAWVVYAGPFRNYGQVLILNAGADIMWYSPGWIGYQ